MYGRYGHMADGTHKTVEDDLITDAVMVTKPCTAEDYPSVKELHSGCVTFQTKIAIVFCVELSGETAENVCNL